MEGVTQNSDKKPNIKPQKCAACQSTEPHVLYDGQWVCRGKFHPGNVDE